MPRMIILTEADLRGLLTLDTAAVDCIEAGFAALATLEVVMPPILRLDIPEHHGEVDVKTAYVPGVDAFAIKMSPGFFDNPKLGLPSVSGLVVLLGARTGMIEALLLDNGYLTDVRTAAAGAVAARHLARRDSRVAAVFGAGTQAKLQLEALSLVRPIREARIWARDPAKAQKTAAELARRLSIPVAAEPDPERVTRGADVIVTTTPADAPILKAAWLSPGQHVTAMGSDSQLKNELEPAILAGADLYVADRLAQTRVLGELRAAIEARMIPSDATFPELGQIVSGKAPGRSSDTQITVADLTGTGVQDTAIATLARDRAKSAGVGTSFES